MIDGETGVKIPGRDVKALHRAMEQLMDPLTRTRMSHDARVFAERNRVDEPFTAILDAAAYRRRLHADDTSASVTVQILEVPDEERAPAWAQEDRVVA
jgi:hypothetical protein